VIAEEKKPLVYAGVAALATLVASAIVWGITRVVKGASAPAPVVSGETVVLVGDSLGFGMKGPLSAALSASGIQLVGNPTVGWNAHQALGDLLSSDASGAAFVASLGSNDAALMNPSNEAGDVQALVDVAFARGARRFLWVIPPNFLSDSPPTPAAFTALWTDPRVEVLQAPVELLAGGDHSIHPGPAGYQTLAGLVAEALTRAA
jgi:hypothetical protein